MRERKELAAGETESQAIARFEDAGHYFDTQKFECLKDEQTGVWSVYHKRRPKRETWRPVTRVARTPYANGYGKDRRPVVVTLLPRELIETRLKGTRRRYTISWDDLHALLVRRHAFAVMRARQAEKAKRRKERAQARKRARR